MLILDATTKTFEAKLAGAVAANTLPFTVNWVDILSTDQSVSALGSTDGTITGAGAVTLLAAPAANHYRVIKSLTVHNADTTGATLTVQLNNNGTARVVFKALLATLDNVDYTD